MKKTLTDKNTFKNKKSLKNKKLQKYKTISKIRKIKTNSKKKRLYVGGMEPAYTEEVLNKFDGFDKKNRGYRYLETDYLSRYRISNSLDRFATTCAYIVKDAPGNPYQYPDIPKYDDDDDDSLGIEMFFFQKKNRDFNSTKLNAFAVGDYKDEFIQILKKQLNAFDTPHNAPYVCALKQVYKIHLQPKLEYLEHYINAFNELYRQNPTMLNGILAFKVIADYNSINEINKLPVIVLYPKDVNSTRDILHILKNNIEYIPNSSIGIVPRHNYGIPDTQDILYIANGDGDIKNTIIENGHQQLDNGSDIISNVFEDTPEFPNAFIKGSEIFNEL